MSSNVISKPEVLFLCTVIHLQVHGCRGFNEISVLRSNSLYLFFSLLECMKPQEKGKFFRINLKITLFCGLIFSIQCLNCIFRDRNQAQSQVSQSFFICSYDVPDPLSSLWPSTRLYLVDPCLSWTVEPRTGHSTPG